MDLIFEDQEIRLGHIIDTSWNITFERVVSGKLLINKESSLQLHLSKTLFELGNIYCIFPQEFFEIEMETNYEGKSIDIVCKLGDKTAAIELKCFMKASNRAKELDCYDVLKDVERLHNFNGFTIKKFFCLTDNKYYPEWTQRGHGKTVSLRNGIIYYANQEIIPGWAQKWNVKRDKSIILKSDIICNWVSKNNWHFLKINS